MNNSLDVNTALHLILQAALRAVAADGACIEWPGDDGTLVFRDAIGTSARALGLRLHVGQSFSGRCFASGEPQLCDDSETDARVDLNACRAVSARAMLALPLRKAGRTVGVLKVTSTRPGAFDQGSLRVLEPLAGLIADAATLGDDAGTAPAAVTALHESDARFRAFMDKVPGLAWIKDADGHYLYVNGPHAEQFGVEPRWLLGRLDSDFLPADVAAALREKDAKVLRTGNTLESIEMVPMPSGRRIAWLTIKFPLEIQGCRVVGGIAVDVTERQRLQQRAELADRLASLGKLTAGISHEVNNPLAYVIGNLETMAVELEALAPKLPAGTLGEMGAMVAETLEGAHRVLRIVQTLKTFARDAQVDPRGPVDVLQAVRRAVELVGTELSPAELVLDLEPVPAVLGDERSLAQVFRNLLSNAASALLPPGQGGHRIRLTSRSEHGKAVIEVHDSGRGIPLEHVGRIFDPFFTTRPPGAGVGLGLSICHSIVTSLGGDIAVESAPGATTFRVVLPAA